MKTISQLELNDETTRGNDVIPVKNSRIYLAAITANLSAFAVGTCITWPSPIGPKLRSAELNDSPLSRPVSANEEAWISSMIGIGALIMPFIAGPLSDKIGRKKVLLSSSLLFILGYILMLIGSEVWILIVGRLIKGFGIGFVMCVSPMYVGEISNDKTRGATGVFMPFLLVLGIFFVLCIGPFVSYYTLQYFCLLVPIIFDITFIFMPESPFYYIAKGQRAAASKALQFLRGQNSTAVETELSTIECMVTTSMAQKGSFLDIVKSAGNRKALLISMGLIFFQQVSGINAVLFNTQTIFESAHLNISAPIAAIILGVVSVTSGVLSPFVGFKFGRKITLLYSATFMFIGLAAIGYYFYAQNVLRNTTGITWLPLPALVLYTLALGFGLACVPWTMLGEIFPSNVKSIAAALTVSFNWTIGSIVPLIYPALDALGTYYVFWLFAAFCLLAFFFILFFVFETKGLSLSEIQSKLNKQSLQNTYSTKL